MTRLAAAELEALGFDPTPGDLEALAAGVDTVRAAGAVFAEISHALHADVDEGTWRGRAADGFRALVAEEFRPLVDLAAQSLADTAHALYGWVEYMRAAHATTRRLAADAAHALAQAVRAEAALAALPLAAPMPTDPFALRAWDDAALDRTRAGNAVIVARENLDAIRRTAARHGADYDTEQAIVASAVHGAAELAPNEPGLWDRVRGAAGDLLGGLGNALGEINDRAVGLAAAVAPIAQLVGDLAGALGAVCGVLAFVPGLQALGFVAVVLGGLALLGHYTAMVGSTGSFVDPFTDRAMLTTLATDGVGFVAGVGAYRAGNAVAEIARQSGQPMRTVARFGIGTRGFGNKEIPEGLFGLAARGPYPMGHAEFGHRVVQFRGDVVGLGVSALEAPGHRDAFAELGRLANPTSTPLPTTASDRPTDPEPRR
ncbi:MAG: hypothetical protein ACT4QG_02995 [Sporichthyaceae bacterium]